MAKDDDRAERLAQALRDNLKRRKAQTRERDVQEPVRRPTAPSPD